MDMRMKTQLALGALAMAYWYRKPPKGLLHHSDRGSQYACPDYRKRLEQYGMRVSCHFLLTTTQQSFSEGAIIIGRNVHGRDFA